MLELFLAALALMLIFEGILPTLAPRRWRETMFQIARLNDSQVRLIGMGSLAAGLMLLYFV